MTHPRQENTVLAPEIEASDWVNTPEPIMLAHLRGRVVLVEAFQMLCPACVSHSLPQAMRVMATFGTDDVFVLGLHSVFEHHAAQGTRSALSAFLHEYRISFPVAIDMQSGAGRLPKTMSAYEMQGTPTLLLIDRQGRLRKHWFGPQPDLKLGAEIMALVAESGDVPNVGDVAVTDPEAHSSNRCAVPTMDADAAG
jgi:hypothetical protein